ncbi:MAG TPA: hypothetical protein VIP06_02845 [Nocardioides sp.]
MTAAVVARRTSRGAFNQRKALQEATFLAGEIVRVQHFGLTASRSNGVWIRTCNCGKEFRSTSYTAAGDALDGHCKNERSSTLMEVSTR